MKNLGFIPPELRRLEGYRDHTLIALFRFAEREPLCGIASLVDWRLCGHLSRLVIEGKLDGRIDESLLVPTERQLGVPRLVLLGLGSQEGFDRDRFVEAVERMFAIADGLGVERLLTCLPGRAEQVIDTASGLDWFLSVYDRLGETRDVLFIESTGAQKAMMPIVERWRLKQLIP